MSEEKDLYVKLDVLKNKIPQPWWKYYHVSSIENFVFHLDNIKNERSRSRTSDNIENYIDIAINKAEDPSDVATTSKELFAILWKIADFYRYELGFIRKPDYLITTILVIVIFFLLKLILTTTQSLVICIIGFVGYFIHAQFKVKARKVY